VTGVYGNTLVKQDAVVHADGQIKASNMDFWFHQDFVTKSTYPYCGDKFLPVNSLCIQFVGEGAVVGEQKEDKKGEGVDCKKKNKKFPHLTPIPLCLLHMECSKELGYAPATRTTTDVAACRSRCLYHRKPLLYCFYVKSG